MRFKIVTFIMLLSGLSIAQTYLSGQITSNTTYSASGNPYIVTGDVSVNAGVVLTISPGAVVYFNSGRTLTVNGKISAESVTFTSIKDTSGGYPQPGDWSGIQISNTASDVSLLKNCKVAYGYNNINLVQGSLTVQGCTVSNASSVNLYVQKGTLNVYSTSAYFSAFTWNVYNLYIDQNNAASIVVSRSEFYNAAVNVRLSFTGTATIDSSKIYNTTYNGNSVNLSIGTANVALTNSSVYYANHNIDCEYGTLNLTNDKIFGQDKKGVGVDIRGTAATVVFHDGNAINATESPIVYEAPASLSFSGTNTIQGNSYDVISVAFGGGSSVPYNFILNPTPVPYYFPYNFTVQSDSKVTIAPGAILKFNSGGSISVEGKFHAEGVAGNPVIFTAITDDNIGGDSNGDGTLTSPYANYWQGIIFQPNSIDTGCVVRRCTFRFAGSNNLGSISTYDASPTIDYNDISLSYYGIMIEGESDPVVSNNVIGVCNVVPVAMSIYANPQFSNNSFSTQDNQYDAIGLLGGELTRDGHLIKRSFTNINNVTYLILNNIRVPSGKTLTIDKGIVIKALSAQISIAGKLVADATADSMIVFTSVKDDNFGNPWDTNRDGTQTSPSVGDWYGIIFEATADSSSVINYCRLEYGYNYYTYYNGQYWGSQITIINSSPRITNNKIENVVIGVLSGLSAKPKIWNNSFTNTSSTPIAISVSSDPLFIGNTFTNVSIRALGIIGENVSLSGTLKKRDLAGFTNITYVLLSDLVINSGTNISMEPGVVVKFMPGSSIYVDGGMKIKGTIAGGKIVFTSLRDDNFGNPGDTNNDGTATAPQAGDWGSIVFRGTSDDSYSQIDSTLIKYASSYQGGVTYIDAGSQITNTTISDCYFGLMFDGTSTALANNVQIVNCKSDPIAISLKADPNLQNITFTANASKGIRILEGTLSSNATLKKRNVAGINNIAYIIHNLNIAANAVLTIDPGVVIKFSDYNSAISVDGSLVCAGTATDKITFTSIRDDSRGGDTNNDGNGSSPGKGDWYCIRFNNTSVDETNLMRNVDFRYGGSGYDTWGGVVIVVDAKVTVDSCSFSNVYTHGLTIYNSANPVISNTTFNNIDGTPVLMSMFSNPTFSNITAYNIGIMALGILPETYSSDATFPIRNFAGYTNITYYLYGTCRVNTGTTLTIPAGLVFKNARFDVEGALKVMGQPNNKVIFTSLEDDNYGNPKDSQGNGNATSPYVSNECGIFFDDVSVDSLCLVNNVIFKYYTYGIKTMSASPTIKNTVFRNNTWGVSLDGVSAPVLDSCKFIDLAAAPLLTSVLSYPVSTVADSLSGTTFKMIGVRDETLSQDYTLTKRNFAGINNIPYLFGSYTIGTGVSLALSPGLILKFRDYGYIRVYNSLIAKGGPEINNNIVFTSYRDDFYGGDSNADSNSTVPYSSWNGIIFENESLDPLCVLENTVIRYANSAITANNADPTIHFSLIRDNQSGVVANGSSNPDIQWCDIYNNSQIGVNNVNGSFIINAQNCWWGNNNGPSTTASPDGGGQNISDNVNYQPYRTSGAVNPLPGDVSLNGKIQSYDAALILKYIVHPAGVDSLNSLQQKVADVSNNGILQSYDASLILQYIIGQIDFFPTELSKKAAYPEKSKNLDKILASQKVQSGKLVVGGGQFSYGDSVNIPLSIANINGLTSGEITLSYNPKLLSVGAVNTTDLTSKVSFAFHNDDQKGILKIAFAGNQQLQASGQLFTIPVKMSKDISGIQTANLTVTEFFANETDLSKQAESNTMSISGKPSSYVLSQNYPNPFNPTTTISYQVPEDNANVVITIYNTLGEVTKVLVNSVHRAGYYKIQWDGTNGSGNRVSSGVFICHMRVGNKFSSTKKLLMLK